MWRRSLLLFLVFVGGAGVSLYALRPLVLTGIGGLLLTGGAPRKVDVIVVMRGDEELYDRAQTAARLFRQGYAPTVYVSAALSDVGSRELRSRAISVPSGQDNIVAILRRGGVPCDRIILDRSSGGGGTAGEMQRVLRMAQASGASSVLIVTSWFHARRVAMLMRQVLGPTLMKRFLVVADSAIGPHNWWTHRYAAIIVVEEFVKLALEATVGSIAFGDDPGEEWGVAAIGPPSSCVGSADMLH
jgi:uncharacterized SAM-binding protein YcdF (DUF218 family)